MDEDEILVVQETEYTGAGEHPWAQLNFAAENGIVIKRGDPSEEVPGKNIIIPEYPSQIQVKEVPLESLRRSYIRNAIADLPTRTVSQTDLNFLVDETRGSQEFVEETLMESGICVSQNS